MTTEDGHDASSACSGPMICRRCSQSSDEVSSYVCSGCRMKRRLCPDCVFIDHKEHLDFCIPNLRLEEPSGTHFHPVSRFTQLVPASVVPSLITGELIRRSPQPTKETKSLELNVNLHALLRSINEFDHANTPSVRLFVGQMEKPFQCLRDGTWLHRAEKFNVDVYSLLIDAYRLYMDLLYGHLKVCDRNSAPRDTFYRSGLEGAKRGFKTYLMSLQNTNKRPKPLPRWFTSRAVKEAIEFGSGDSAEFYSLKRVIDLDFLKHRYKDGGVMAAQILIFAAQAWGYRGVDFDWFLNSLIEWEQQAPSMPQHCQQGNQIEQKEMEDKLKKMEAEMGQWD